jgi:hypothetical protein
MVAALTAEVCEEHRQPLEHARPLVKRLAELERAAFDHGRPADYLLRNRDKLCPDFSATTLDRFEQLFRRVNQTLP